MNKEFDFLIYCMEIVKRARNLTGKQVYSLFEKHNLFVFVTDFFELLHVHGENYILKDIDEHIKELST